LKSIGSLIISKYVGTPRATGSTGTRNGQELGCFFNVYKSFQHNLSSGATISSEILILFM
jgi:hypothetical protein